MGCKVVITRPLYTLYAELLVKCTGRTCMNDFTAPRLGRPIQPSPMTAPRYGGAASAASSRWAKAALLRAGGGSFALPPGSAPTHSCDWTRASRSIAAAMECRARNLLFIYIALYSATRSDYNIPMHARAALPHACSWLHVRVGFLARFRARGIFLRESLSKVAAAAALQLLLWYKKPP